MNRYSTEEARLKLGDIVLDAQANIPSEITYHRIPMAVVLGYEEWLRLRHLAGLPLPVHSRDSAIAREGHSAG